MNCTSLCLFQGSLFYCLIWLAISLSFITICRFLGNYLKLSFIYIYIVRLILY